jgi:proteic killer suppression protein
MGDHTLPCHAIGSEIRQGSHTVKILKLAFPSVVTTLPSPVLWEVREFQAFARQAEQRLRILDAADTLRALQMLPSNRLEALKGDRQGQYSIRINQQWRVCFEWHEDGLHNVEIVDYH